MLISGGGRTLKNLIELIAEDQLPVEIALVIASSDKAGGLAHAAAAGIPHSVVQRPDYASDELFGAAVFSRCRTAGVDLVVMAGWLKLTPVPDDFIGRVVNIHPSLLPAFGGQGMYGDRVHKAVLARGCKVTGLTVHYVDNEYDAGPIIWQMPVPVFDDDTSHTLADRVFEAEKEAYPHVLRLLQAGRVKLAEGRVRIGRGHRAAGSEMPAE
ncbi:phosphoribosylglycinamide formyltransferase [Botrimarina hoheduenensis]|uniref:Phosphoribosylglycinamide formyltransferase n=1 Tax=Botrimarina hoheduenensis TaxID=2528000 RepID=A0A5C5WFT3_9BACT|nr:phosphoribosylglycinamide formyltransferase [Botrimarina hoheduenensis]TWT48622.1 Phosphoribosylglycinamide formyltransferase [Botrimarina hoheduenensis]